MEKLYTTLLELIGEIPEIRWVDLEAGQMQEEYPPVAFPCVLIDFDIPSTENIIHTIQNVNMTFSIRLNCKVLSETNGKAPKPVRTKALEYFGLVQKIYEKLQGYNDNGFVYFNRLSVRNENLRKGIKTVVLRFETSYYDDTANS